jgi:transcriptional regulator with XRE-family HTH domain
MKTNIIEYITRNKGLTQKEIATQLGVSGTQITKWKQGEKIPQEQQKKLNEVSEVSSMFNDDLDWAALVNNDESNAEAWFDFFNKIYGRIDSWELDGEAFTPALLKGLSELGVAIPCHPKLLEKKPETEDGETRTFIPLEDLLLEHAEDWSSRVTWVYKFISDELLVDDNLEFDIYDLIENLKWGIVDISLATVDKDTLLKAGVDLEKFDNYIETARESSVSEIDSLYRYLNSKDILFSQNYFKIIESDWEDLEDDINFSGTYPTIENYLPYSAKVTFKQLGLINDKLNNLHKKVDQLLKVNASA